MEDPIGRWSVEILLLIVCAVLALSMGITWCLKKIPVIGGYLL